MRVLKRKGALTDVVVLLLLVTAVLLIVHLRFAAAGKAPIRTVDGIEQHYVFFLYLGKWARTVVRTLLAGQGLVVPVWEMSMGYGADMVTSSAAYIADPFNWISVITPPAYSEAVFCVTIAARFYCAGLAFLLFCWHRGYARWASIVVSALYATCGVMLILPIETYLVNPMILFPFAVWGVDRIMDGGSPVLFVVSLAAILLVYFYFGYMACILLVPVCVAEYFRRWPLASFSARHFLRMLVRMLLFVALAIAISAVLLLPVAEVLFGAGRLGLERPLDALYSQSYYIGLFAGFATSYYTGPDSYFGFGAVGAAGVALLLALKGKGGPERFLLAVFTLFLLVPLFGKVLNGFAYVGNRWIWGYAFAVCQGAALGFSELRSLSGKRLYAAGAGLALYGVLLAVLAQPGFCSGVLNKGRLFAAACVLVLALVLVVAPRLGVNRLAVVAVPAVAAVLVVACSGAAFWLMFKGTLMDAQHVAGTALQTVTSDSNKSVFAQQAAAEPGGGDWRVDDEAAGVRNTALANGVKSFDFYISVYNNVVDKFHGAVGLRGACFNFSYLDLDQRPWLAQALGARYMVSGRGEQMSPHGYDKVDSPVLESKGLTLLESPGYRPIASLQERVYSADDFWAASMAEREEMVASGAVLDAATAQASGSNGFAASSRAVESRLEGAGEASVAGGGAGGAEGAVVEAHAADAAATLEFQTDEPGNVYLEFYGCEFAPVADVGTRTVSIFDEEGVLQSTVVLLNPRDHMYGGKRDWLANLGNYKPGKHSVRLVFNCSGTYRFANVRVVQMPHESLDKLAAEATSARGRTSTVYGVNTVTCNVDAKEGEVLVVTTPWSSGWSALIDGKPAPVHQANVAFLGVEVPAGKHEVVLHYETPGLKAGAALSVAGIVLTVLLAFRRRSSAGDETSAATSAV